MKNKIKKSKNNEVGYNKKLNSWANEKLSHPNEERSFK